jgi:hypothetical protein
MSVNASGVTVTNVQTDLLSGNFHFEADRIYSFSGDIIDPVSRTQLGRFSVPPAEVRGLAVDLFLHRVFFLCDEGSAIVRSFDLDTFVETGGVFFPEIPTSGGISSLIRWGDTGLAFRTATQVIAFQIPSNWLHPTPLSVSKSGTGSGTVISFPAGINCGATCSTGYELGEFVTLTAIASTGSVFIGWSGDSDCIDGSLTMYASRSCVARFDLPQSNLTRLRGDLNGDGMSDILWQHTDGRSSAWSMNGVNLSAGAGLLGPGTGWSIIRRADFNADGKTDILWQKSDGSVAAWLMDGMNLSSGAALLGPGTAWSVSNVGDFNGDGKSDILWQHTDGSSAIWLMNGLNLLSGVGLLGPGTGWSVSNVGDFNGDGKSDILWQNTDGSSAIWLMNGLGLSAVAVVLGPATGWSPKDVGDFNGDGKSDIIWQHTDGSTAMWLVDGLGILSATIVRPAGTGYSVNRVGDFDGDGKSDLLWQYTDGTTEIWLMDGMNVKSVGGLLGPGTGWSPVP